MNQLVSRPGQCWAQKVGWALSGSGEPVKKFWQGKHLCTLSRLVEDCLALVYGLS